MEIEVHRCDLKNGLSQNILNKMSQIIRIAKEEVLSQFSCCGWQKPDTIIKFIVALLTVIEN
jgi:hypothetical protein